MGTYLLLPRVCSCLYSQQLYFGLTVYLQERTRPSCRPGQQDRVLTEQVENFLQPHTSRFSWGTLIEFLELGRQPSRASSCPWPMLSGEQKAKIETIDFLNDAVSWFSVAFLGSITNHRFQITLTWTSSHKVQWNRWSRRHI